MFHDKKPSFQPLSLYTEYILLYTKPLYIECILLYTEPLYTECTSSRIKNPGENFLVHRCLRVPPLFARISPVQVTAKRKEREKRALSPVSIFLLCHQEPGSARPAAPPSTTRCLTKHGTLPHREPGSARYAAPPKHQGTGQQRPRPRRTRWRKIPPGDPPPKAPQGR